MSESTPLGFSAEDLAARIAEAQASGKPQVLYKGQVAIYATPEGGLHLAHRSADTPDGEPDSHIPIPQAMLRLVLAQAQGNAGPIAMAKAMIGR